MKLPRRSFLAGLPLLGFLAPLLKPLAPRPVLSAASLPEDTVITFGPKELARMQTTLTTREVIRVRPPRRFYAD